MGYDTIAAGDSYNDLDMIRASKAGFCSAARSRSAGIIRSCRRTRPLQTCWRLSGGRCDKRETTQEEHRNGSETQKLFLKLLDFTPEEIGGLIDLAAELKAKKKKGVAHDTLRGKILR